MVKVVEIKVEPARKDDDAYIRERALHKARVKPERLQYCKIDRRSIDARGKHPVYRFRIHLYLDEPYTPPSSLLSDLHPVTDRPAVHIIGAGPAGYFAALELIECGYKPILFDRGKDVRERRRDLRAIQQEGIVDPDSNYCFGEGGAGTYSDGKLYTRSHKRGNIEKILRMLVEHGAQSDILTDAHPHIGSNKLPKVVANIRQTILDRGGEIHFHSKLTDLVIRERKIAGVIINDQEEVAVDRLILATGHSARDIYYLLHRHGIRLEAKPFALGVRIEHPQSLIDHIQYGQAEREDNLPASSYRLVCQVEERGVFSFCMCPGGLVVPAATAPGEIVVNGMSLSRRDSPYANSGTVVAVELEDLAILSDTTGVFAGLDFQRQVEQAVFKSGDGSQRAPAQRLTDFIKGKQSADLPATSYIPGLFSAPVHQILPQLIYERLRRGIETFGRKMPGYLTREANVIATESRTSSPVRIPRDPDQFMHEDCFGLFPCGEGAGFAGGIVSAALDGQRVARAVAESFSIR